MTDAGDENHNGPSGESRDANAAAEKAEAAGPRNPESEASEPDTIGTDTAAFAVVARAGPGVLEQDSWDEVPQVTSNRAYEGRRRAAPPPARRWILLGAILVGLGATAALTYALTASRETVSAAPTPTTPHPAASSPASSGEATPSSSPVPSATVTPAASSTTTLPPRPPARFEPITLEAENGELSGSADDQPYAGASGGRIVMRIGEWGRRADGVLTLRNIVIPTAGRYAITIYYVHPNNDPTRHARITISNHEPVQVAFDGNSTCCKTKVLTLDLTAGSKTLRIEGSTPEEQAPSVDKIVISRA